MLGPLLLIVTGVALVLDGPWGFRDTWVIVGLVGYVGALALGGALQAPGTKRVNAMLAERTPDDRRWSQASAASERSCGLSSELSSSCSWR